MTSRQKYDENMAIWKQKTQASQRDVERARAEKLACYFRCFSTVPGQAVLKDIKALLPSKISGKTELDTIRNAAVRDVIDYIVERIEQGENPDAIPTEVNPNSAEVRNG